MRRVHPGHSPRHQFVDPVDRLSVGDPGEFRFGRCPQHGEAAARCKPATAGLLVRIPVVPGVIRTLPLLVTPPAGSAARLSPVGDHKDARDDGPALRRLESLGGSHIVDI